MGHILRGGSLGRRARSLTAAERWRLPHLAALGDVLGIRDATLEDIKAAFTADKKLLPCWMKAMANAAGIDLIALASQAALVLDAWRRGNADVMNIMFAPAPSPPACDSAGLTNEDIGSLIDALGATSGWIAASAYDLLLSVREPAIAERLTEHLSLMHPRQRYYAAAVAVINDRDPFAAAQRMFGQRDLPTVVSRSLMVVDRAGG